MAFIQCDFFSEVLGISTSMNVILPQNTKRQIGMEGRRVGQEKPPVLYLLHGLSDDHTIWMRRTSIERYVAPLGLAVVMPAVDKSFYVDMACGERYGEFVGDELPEIVASFFQVSEKRSDTFVAGLSMGGYGAFLLALSRPARFAAAASLSGVLDIANFPRESTDETRMNLFRRVFGDPENLSGSDYDLLWLSAKLAESGAELPRLYQCCGTEDFLHTDNVKFKNHIETLPFDHQYDEAPGTHEWGFWDAHIQKALQWMIPR
jgi:S-formylglutathione hydrolase FrmB